MRSLNLHISHFGIYVKFVYYTIVAMAKKNLIARRERLQALLRELRLEAGLRQVELAERLCRPQSFVSKYESGQRRLDLVELGQLCQAVGISLAEFVRRFEHTEP